jgi:flagellar basal body-associated protein FliL
MELNRWIFKWLMIIIVILIIALIGTNIAWFIYESQFQVETTNSEQTQTVENVQSVHDITQN